MSEKRPISEVLRRACVGDYETVGDAETNAQEIMESCHELLAIVEAAKEMEWFLSLLMTTTKILRGSYARQANDIRMRARAALDAAAEEPPR